MFTLTRSAKLKSQNKRHSNIKETSKYGKAIRGQLINLISMQNTDR